MSEQLTQAPQGAEAGAAAGDSARKPESFDSDMADLLAQTLESGQGDGALQGTGDQTDSADDDADTAPQERQADDGKDAAAQEADPEIAVKIDGAEKRVKQSELIAHYQKGEAASKRFEEAAALRRATEQEQVRITEERQHLGEALQHYTQQIQAMQQVQQTDWDQLLQDDPAEFQRQRFHFERQQAQLAQAQAAQAHLAQQQAALQEQQMRQRVQSESARLAEVLPEWSDPAKAKEEAAAIRQSLAGLGYTDAELDALNDHRAVIVARKAMLYERMVAQQRAASQQVSTKLASLPPTRVEKPGGGETANPTDGRTRAMRNLSRSGSVQDATEVLKHFF